MTKVYDVVVVGSANADMAVGVERRPAVGETVLGSALATHPGGKGANQAVAAARLGARVALVSRVGDDAHGRFLLKAQKAAGVCTHAVQVGGAPTGVALIMVGPQGDDSIVVSPGANALLSPEDTRASQDLLSAARVVSLQLEIPLATVAAAVTAAGPQTRVVLNPSPPAPLSTRVLAACDPLVLNEHEARAMLGDTGEHGTPEEWCTALLRLGPRSVVVTLGAEGAVAADASGAVRVPGIPVAAVDTTGDGDAFTGALAWRLAQGDTLAQAVEFAVRVGAAAVPRAGAQDSFPTLEHLADREHRETSSHRPAGSTDA
ncbi:ribokinase [Streptomyces sp. NBC_00988]|uniref:ribokinase n=1 Tax=Streptomyces sp. NBC_00988 TaxID=2903704 RepID=UPI00386FE7A9|nr:ribokinase [Streptomyces sp. NBC_00988]